MPSTSKTNLVLTATKPLLSATLIKRVEGRPVYVVAPPRRPGSSTTKPSPSLPKESRPSLGSAESNSQDSQDGLNSSIGSRASSSSVANVFADTSANSIASVLDRSSNLGLNAIAKSSTERAPSLTATNLPVPQIKPKPPHRLAFEFQPLTQPKPGPEEHERFPEAMEQDISGVYAPRAKGGPMMRNITTKAVNEPVRTTVSSSTSRAESEEVLAFLGRSFNVSKGKAREVTSSPAPSSTFESPSSSFYVPPSSSFIEQTFSSPIARRTAASSKRRASPARQTNLTQAQEQYPTPIASTSPQTQHDAAPNPTPATAPAPNPGPLPPTAPSRSSHHEDGLRCLLKGMESGSRRARKRVSRPEGMIDWWAELQEQKKMKKNSKGKGKGKAEESPNQNLEMEDPMDEEVETQQDGDEEARPNQVVAPLTANEVVDDHEEIPDAENSVEIRRLQHAGDDGLRRLLGSVDSDSPRSRKRAEKLPGMVAWTDILTPRSPKKIKGFGRTSFDARPPRRNACSRP
ncbi:BQ2448_1593 [Microbotryum intermedium]|uniref:BQ2448_1593 protein n=1 Tax=Microbotryum intermedium TaxID=269621 RepID=A0A238FBN3_9BASI|nr:BQ2448_1593 [Microbotryum intermedium]